MTRGSPGHRFEKTQAAVNRIVEEIVLTPNQTLSVRIVSPTQESAADLLARVYERINLLYWRERK